MDIFDIARDKGIECLSSSCGEQFHSASPAVLSIPLIACEDFKTPTEELLQHNFESLYGGMSVSMASIKIQSARSIAHLIDGEAIDSLRALRKVEVHLVCNNLKVLPPNQRQKKF